MVKVRLHATCAFVSYLPEIFRIVLQRPEVTPKQDVCFHDEVEMGCYLCPQGWPALHLQRTMPRGPVAG